MEEVDFLCGLVGSKEKERTDMRLENACMKQELVDIKLERAGMKQELVDMRLERAGMKLELVDMKLERAGMKLEINRLTFGLPMFCRHMMTLDSTQFSKLLYFSFMNFFTFCH